MLVAGEATAQRRRAAPAPVAPSPVTPAATVAPTTAPLAAGAPAVAAATGLATLSPPIAAPARPAPERPQDPVGAKAYAVLESYCASCHQSPGAAGGIADILNLGGIARDRSLVRPGVPDASRIYQSMLMGHPPAEKGGGPQPREIEAVRDWVESLPASERICRERPAVDAAELAATMQKWLEQSKPDVAKATRFISLAHLYNACATDAELAAYRQAIQKLLNGLSWAKTPVRIETVGDNLVVLALRLGDIGWVAAHWDRLAGLEPVGGAVPVSDALKAVTGSPRPVLRADWLASAASRAPLYNELLGLPDRLREVMRLHSLEAEAGKAPKAMRAGLKAGSSLGGPTIGERLVAKDGQVLWLAYEWAGVVPTTEVFDNPLAPYVANPGKSPPKPVDSRLMLFLPNGMLAFAGFDADGKRLDAMPPQTTADGKVAAAPHALTQSCLGCHAAGLRAFADEVRGTLGPGKDGKEQPLTAYPQPAELGRLFEDDNYRYRRALIQAGIDPDLTLDGLEIISGLARRFDRPVDLERAAADAGVSYDVFRKRLADVGGDLKPLAQRLLFGLISRAEAERLLAWLRNPAAGATPQPAAALAGAGPQDPIVVSVWPDRLSYKAGDLAHFSVQASEDCYLTLIDIDGAGKATVLLPNDFEQDNLIVAGQVVQVPGDRAPYQLRMKDKGTETLVAICATNAKVPPGVELDFERQRFPSLGLWRNFVREGDTGGDVVRPTRSSTGRGRADAKSGEPVKPEPKLRAGAQGRAAITVQIE